MGLDNEVILLIDWIRMRHILLDCWMILILIYVFFFLGSLSTNSLHVGFRIEDELNYCVEMLHVRERMTQSNPHKSMYDILEHDTILPHISLSPHSLMRIV